MRQLIDGLHRDDEAVAQHALTDLVMHLVAAANRSIGNAQPAALRPKAEFSGAVEGAMLQLLEELRRGDEAATADALSIVLTLIAAPAMSSLADDIKRNASWPQTGAGVEDLTPARRRDMLTDGANLMARTWHGGDAETSSSTFTFLLDVMTIVVTPGVADESAPEREAAESVRQTHDADGEREAAPTADAPQSPAAAQVPPYGFEAQAEAAEAILSPPTRHAFDRTDLHVDDYIEAYGTWRRIRRLNDKSITSVNEAGVSRRHNYFAVARVRRPIPQGHAPVSSPQWMRQAFTLPIYALEYARRQSDAQHLTYHVYRRGHVFVADVGSIDHPHYAVANGVWTRVIDGVHQPVSRSPAWKELTELAASAVSLAADADLEGADPARQEEPSATPDLDLQQAWHRSHGCEPPHASSARWPPSGCRICNAPWTSTTPWSGWAYPTACTRSPGIPPCGLLASAGVRAASTATGPSTSTPQATGFSPSCTARCGPMPDSD
ncbi:hypothetical protein ACFQX6_67050 [Streptosporangium lutulentum]